MAARTNFIRVFVCIFTRYILPKEDNAARLHAGVHEELYGKIFRKVL